MNINELGEQCQKELDDEVLLKKCTPLSKGHCICPEIYGPRGYCDNCPVEKECPSIHKDHTE